METPAALETGARINLARENASKWAQVCLTLARGRLSTLTAVVSTIPFIVTTIHYCLAHADGPVLLTTLIAILPRRVSILQNINVIVVYAIQLSERTTRTTLVRNNLILTNEEKRQHGLIEWGKLRIIPAEEEKSGAVPKNMADIEAATRNFSLGRTTLRGANGSGKSTLLALPKERLEDRTFLLPAHSELYFTELDTKEASSRQAVARILKLLESGYLEKDCDVALLDEWDANLDEKARTAQDRLIDDLAQSKCIIEVLHNSR
ncbi:ABC transporter ATP-binding protein [Collinsella aerofaciens]|uniref:ATP-binding cassette domain-containing protein n=1 Tax=Collinsella aerofaciens TaxID=74426 RepID=UPI00355C8FAA